MKNLWWAATDTDDLIISDMHEYVRAKNNQRWWCCCCCGGGRDKCEIAINKRFKKEQQEMVVVTVSSHSEIKEWLHYYALCAIAAHHGAQLLLSV